MVWSLSAVAAAYGAAEVGLGSVSREGQGVGPGLVGIWCWEGRPGEDFGRPSGEGWGVAPFSPLGSVSSLEHCWADSGLCPLALGSIALYLQL